MSRLPDPVPLPDYVAPAACLRAVARRLRPPAHITVSEAAARWRHVHNPGGGYSGPWRNETTPYLVEPADAITSRRHEAVIFCGPAQCGKTDGLVVNPQVHAIEADPADTLIVHMTQESARDFSFRRFDRLVRHSPTLQAQAGKQNVYDKHFVSGVVSIAWPAISHLSGRPIPRVFVTDLDRMPDDVDGEGSVFDLAMGRTKTFGSRGMVLAESSPGRAVTDPRWQAPEGSHLAPPTTGILALYNRGDRRRWHWPCPHCGGYFEPSFARLTWPTGAAASTDPAELAEAVTMACPHCGALIDPAAKAGMNARAGWVPEGCRIDDDGTLRGTPLASPVASFWLRGPAAAFGSWSDLVRKELTARAEYEATGDAAALKVTRGVDQAEPWVPPAAATDSLVPEDLVARCEPWPAATVPEGVRFLTAAIDVQAARFEWLVRGWGIDGESWVIDRGVIFQAADGARPVDPAVYAEDWRLLEAVITARYPLADESGRMMHVARTAIDSAGKRGTTTQAYTAWRFWRGRGLAPRVVLTKGTGRPAAPRWAWTRPDSTGRRDRKAGAKGDIPVVSFQTDAMKNMLDAQLRRPAPGAGYVHLPEAVLSAQPPHVWLEQLCAEAPDADGRWRKVRADARNEALDLMVMAGVAALSLDAERIDWAAPPAWAAEADRNVMVTADDAVAAAAVNAARRGRRVRSPGIARD